MKSRSKNYKLVAVEGIAQHGTIVAIGSLPDFRHLAQENDWQFWKDKSMFGGYYYDPYSETSYLVDVLSPGDKPNKRCPIPGMSSQYKKDMQAVAKMPPVHNPCHTMYKPKRNPGNYTIPEFICNTCHSVQRADMSRPPLQAGDPCMFCPEEEQDSPYPGPVVRPWEDNIYVNVYHAQQAFGGPEEGGWWYDVLEPIESRLCHSREEALAEFQKLEERWEKISKEENQGRPYHSVLSRGEYRVSVEPHFAEVDNRRPRYT